MVVSRTERLVILEKKCILAAGNSSDIDVVLPSGEHLRKTIVRNPSATIAEVLEADAAPEPEVKRRKSVVLGTEGGNYTRNQFNA